ncbi:uncharacterized protein BXZ73DRAFT_99277 [Epithele typhae]|uniref:uncharacterized protein n=1 Tax=Epithele typhae TaxID=378194 RepID=UPI00200725F4|nr:uncharacterized protein BXZ73DRAFT_99277 [Epithele typhae]KAH9939662.1 hypothetical protein BXZ73DRAFT_99277 [Epithele typhae]
MCKHVALTALPVLPLPVLPVLPVLLVFSFRRNVFKEHPNAPIAHRFLDELLRLL